MGDVAVAEAETVVPGHSRPELPPTAAAATEGASHGGLRSVLLRTTDPYGG